MFGFILLINMRNFDFESCQNTLLIFDKKGYGVRFNMSHGKMSDLSHFHGLGSL